MQSFDPRQAAPKHSETISIPKISADEELIDPLLALAGTLTCDVTNISERHDEYIGQAYRPRIGQRLYRRFAAAPRHDLRRWRAAGVEH